MKCPYCESPILDRLIITKCSHCGSSIYYGLHGYSKTPEAALAQAKAMQDSLARAESLSGKRQQVLSTAVLKKGLAEQRHKGLLQQLLESMGLAALYASIFTLITSPLLYFLVQPRLLKSFSVDGLIAGSAIFYFIFGFIAIFLTNRSLLD